MKIEQQELHQKTDEISYAQYLVPMLNPTYCSCKFFSSDNLIGRSHSGKRGRDCVYDELNISVIFKTEIQKKSINS